VDDDVVGVAVVVVVSRGRLRRRSRDRCVVVVVVVVLLRATLRAELDTEIDARHVNFAPKTTTTQDAPDPTRR